jgi:hypothetical protein
MANLENALLCDGGLITAYSRHNPHYRSHLLIHGSAFLLQPVFVLIAKNNAPAAHADDYWVLQHVRLNDALKIDTTADTKARMMRITDALGAGGLVQDLQLDELVCKTHFCRKEHLLDAIEDFRLVFRQSKKITISLRQKLPVADALVQPSDECEAIATGAGFTSRVKVKFGLATARLEIPESSNISWSLLAGESVYTWEDFEKQFTPAELAAVEAAAKSRAVHDEREKAVAVLDRVLRGFVSTHCEDIQCFRGDQKPLSCRQKRAINKLVDGLKHRSVLSSHKRPPVVDWAATITKKTKITEYFA